MHVVFDKDKLRVTLLSLALAFHASKAVKLFSKWTGGRVVEGARLESV